MTQIKEKTVANYVTENIDTAHVFKKNGIDFCCGGAITIAKSCAKQNIDPWILEKELEAVNTKVETSNDFKNWELDFLIDYIVNIHHSYVNESVSLISEYSNKVARVHGENHTEVIEINSLFHEVANELLAHMQKEEKMLFPFIKELVSADKKGEVPSSPPFGTVNNPIRMMEHEHENAGDILKKIAKLTNNYTPPQGACNTFKALYAKLNEFEQDLHKHIHLENNILHPKAIALEKKWRY